MQNKKLLSVLLALMLVVACVFGVLSVGAQAEERTAVTWTIGTDAENLADALAKAKVASWTSDDALVIDLNGTTELATVDENGILFGLATIFDDGGERLPITIQNGTLNVPENEVNEDVSYAEYTIVDGEEPPAELYTLDGENYVLYEGAVDASAPTLYTKTVTTTDIYYDIICANSYTFKDLTFPVLDQAVTFWAGSGEVAVIDCDLDVVAVEKDEAKGFLYADCPTAAPFEGWAKPDYLIEVGLTLDGIDMVTGSPKVAESNVKGVADADGFEGENVSASDLAVSLTVTDSWLQSVLLRPATALSPVASLTFTANDSSETGAENTRFYTIYGAYNSGSAVVTYPDFDLTINLNGGTIAAESYLVRKVIFTGEYTLNVTGGNWTKNIIASYSDGGKIAGKNEANISGGTFSMFYGPNTAAEGFENVVNITGGTFANYCGNRVGGDVTTNVSGGTFTNFMGTYNSTGANGTWSAVNNISGGTFTNFYGTGGITTNATTGITNGVGSASKNATAESVVNNVTGGTFENFYGCGVMKNIKSVQTNISGSAVINGNFYGNKNGSADSEATGSESKSNKINNIVNTIGSGAVIKGNFYGAADVLVCVKENDTDPATAGHANNGNYRIDSVTNHLLGGTVEGTAYGIGVVNVTKVQNNLGGTEILGNFVANKCRGSSGGDIYEDKVAAYSIENIMSAGVVHGDFYGVSSYLSNSEPTTDEDGTWAVKSKFTGGEVKGTFHGTRNNIIKGPILNVVSGGTFQTDYDATENVIYFSGASSNAARGVTNVITGGTFKGKFYGANNYEITSVTNKISGGTFLEFSGTNQAVNGTVTNTVSSPAKITTYYALTASDYKNNNETKDDTSDDFYHVTECTNTITGGHITAIVSNSASCHANISFDIGNDLGIERDDLYAQRNSLFPIRGLNKGGNTSAVLTGNLSYKIRYTYFFKDNTAVFAGCDVKGNLDVYLEKCYANAALNDVANGCYVTGVVTEHLKDCYLAKNLQWVNREGSCRTSATLILENHRQNGGNVTAMNAVACSKNSSESASTGAVMYIYGDTYVNAEAYIYCGRQDNGSHAYLGAKPGENGPVPVETTVSGGGTIGTRRTQDNADCHTIHVYDVTLDGATLRPGYTEGTTVATTDKIILHGNVVLRNGATMTASRVADGLETVTVFEDSWTPGEASVTMQEAGEIDKLVGATVIGGSGYAKKVDNTLVGADLALVSASMNVDERIVIKLWVPSDAVEAYFTATGNELFGVRATITLADGEVTLADYVLAKDALAEYLVGDTYVFEIGAVSANEFDKVISFKGSCFNAEATILSICETGIESNFSGAEIDLFKAIYNYGASVCIDPESKTYYAFKDLGADFVVDDAADATYAVGDTTKVSFERMNLLMGDAIGVRFTGTLVDPAAEIRVLLGGQETDGYYVSVNGDAVTVEMYFAAQDYAAPQGVIITADGEAALGASFSIEGYSEQVKDYGSYGNAELALAQLVQACLNLNS